MSEATATDSTGSPQRIVKGAFAVVIGLAQPSPTAAAAAKELEAKGFRVLAVAAGPPTAMKLAGLIALSDPPRADSAALVNELHGLGVRTVMVTGDAPATAAIVAKAVGLDGAVCPPGPIPDAVHPEQFAVFAGVLPEDKYKLVKAFQKGGHTVGMCGDGANDAPALRQAQMGIAVSTATDVAKSAAGMVLTEPGLAGIVAAVKEGRITFQRILTYTLNSIIKKIVHGALPGRRPDHDRARDSDAAADGHRDDRRRFPRHVVDDRQRAAVANAERLADRQPDDRRNRHGLLPAGLLQRRPGFRRFSWASRSMRCGRWPSSPWCSGARRRSTPFVERRHLWGSRPSLWLAVSSVADILIASALSIGGIAMTPLPAWIVAGTLGAAAVFAVVAGSREGSGLSTFGDRLEPRLAAEGMKMKISSKDFRAGHYPKTGAKRRKELLSIRKQLAK